MLWQPSIPERYSRLTGEELASAIASRRQELGSRLLILGHHYQQDDVIQHADLTGDSLKLSQMAATECVRRGTESIVFCGVHFMAETADLLTPESVQVILPDLSAGCSMADMAVHDDAVDAWQAIHDALGRGWSALGDGERGRVIPITYVNSSAAIKAFVGAHGGACCTSSNAGQIFDWALAGGQRPRRQGEDIRILFLPDQHLGRNTASSKGFLTEVDEAAGRGSTQTAVYNPRKPGGGLSAEAICSAQVILWAGHCSVHKLFRPEHVDQARATVGPEGEITVMVHPECCKEVVDKADLSGSTEFIIRTIEEAAPGSRWAVGTEVHLVNRLARRAAERGVHVRMLSECQCLCTTMYRIDQAHLLWVLDHLVKGRVLNQIAVPPEIAGDARLALDRMLANVASSPVAVKGAMQTALVD